MQFRALNKVKKDDKKNKLNDRNMFHNKVKRNKVNKELIEYNKVYILSPTINIANKQCYIFEPLNADVEYSINANKFINNFDNDEIILKRPNIKVKCNKINISNKNYVAQNNKNTSKNKKLKKNNLNNEKQQRIIFNYSNIDNHQNNNNNTNVYHSNSIKNSFESSRENFFQQNKNKSYTNYFKKSCDKKDKIISNRVVNLKAMNINKTFNEHYNNTKESFYNKADNKISTKQSMNHISFNDSNLNILNIKDFSNFNIPQLEFFERNNNLMQSKCLTNSHSFKSYAKSERTNLSLTKSNQKNKNNKENISLFSPQYNRIQNTYQKKLINHFSRTDKYALNKNGNNSKEKTNMKNLLGLHNSKFNFPNNYSSSSSLSVLGLLNTKKEDDNQDTLNDKIDSKRCNKNLYNNLNYNNNEKEEKIIQNEQSDQNYNTDYNYSTSNSFYNKSNNTTTQRLLSSNRLEHKLKNIITSINYKNNGFADNNKNEKKIILYEVDRKGKVNYKVREMKSSVEKIVRENSELKKRNKMIEYSPRSKKPGIFSLYVKKNQGTVLRKIKGKNKIEFYSNNDNNN